MISKTKTSIPLHPMDKIYFYHQNKKINMNKKFLQGFDIESKRSTIGLFDSAPKIAADGIWLGKSTDTLFRRLRPYKNVLPAYNSAEDVREKEKLCLYDGIKFRSYSLEYIAWIKEDQQRKQFKLQPTKNPQEDADIYFSGRFQNLEIKIHYSKKGWAVDFSGSVHKFFNSMVKNGRENYNNFYWNDFMAAYDEIIKVFCLNPSEIEVVNLEVGVNCKLPDDTPFSVSEIIENILSFCGTYTNKNRHSKIDRDSYRVDRGEYYLKFYDKAKQYFLSERIVRMELGYKRARPIYKDGKVRTLFDLTCPIKHDLLKNKLLQSFEAIRCHHPTFLHIPQFEIKTESDIYEFDKATYWQGLKKTSRYKYKKKCKKHEQLIEKYFPINPRSVLLKMLREKLS